MNKTNNSIWKKLCPRTASVPLKINPKRITKVKICINEFNKETPIITTNTSNSRIPRKRGRRKIRSNEPFEMAFHTKDNDDNIKRKVKTHFHNFIIAYLNVLMKNTLKTKRQYKFRKMSSKMTQNITISYNKKLLETSIKDIIIQVSDKFKNKDINFLLIGKITQNKESNVLNDVLNITYKDMLQNYYLKSTAKIFENEKYDESYEKHIQNLINKYGYNYAMKFKQNAEGFIDFYLTSKQRNHKNKIDGISHLSPEKNLDVSDNKDECEENENENEEQKNFLNPDSQILIKNLKPSVNNEDKITNPFNDKKFFKIVQGNSTADKTKSTHSNTSRSDKSEDEEKEKVNRERKIFLNKKRVGPFNVFLCTSYGENA